MQNKLQYKIKGYNVNVMKLIKISSISRESWVLAGPVPPILSTPELKAVSYYAKLLIS